MNHPPQHKIDAKCVYVPMRHLGRDSEAWDWDRINKEVRSKKKTEIHPVIQYFTGVTRYDIEAHGVKDYLNENPPTFIFRRLKLLEFERVRTRLIMEDPYGAQRLAVQHALEEIQNVDVKIDNLGKKPLDDDDCEEIADAIGRDTFYEIGQAIIKASGDLADAERKSD